MNEGVNRDDTVNMQDVRSAAHRFGDNVILTSGDICVCCGEIVPEGRMVCPTCEVKYGAR